jgi:DNA-binding transcriptional LysR family regulator
MQIRELEKELDVELVERRPGDAALTELGVLVAKRGDEVLAAARDLVDFARHRGRLFKGQLKLGVIPTLGPYLLPKLLPLLHLRHPDLVIKLRETQTKALIEELVAGDLDAVMVSMPAPEVDIEVIQLFDDPFLLAVPADDPHSETARVTSDEVDQSRLILPAVVVQSPHFANAETHPAPSFVLEWGKFGAPDRIRTCGLRLRRAAAWPDRCLRGIVNLMVPTAKKGLAFGSKRSVCMDIPAVRRRCPRERE